MNSVSSVSTKRELFIQWCEANGVRKPASCL